MKTWQNHPNSIHYTEEKLFCDFCFKQNGSILDFSHGPKSCFKCFKEPRFFERIFGDSEFLLVRQINDVMFLERKETKKRERQILTLKLRYKILKRDGFKCILCQSNHLIEIDHIVPISSGGKTIEENLRTLCFKCNRGKSNG